MSREMKWRKIGMIFCPSGERDWMLSHAAVPFAENIGDDSFKIYFSSRDSFNRSHTGFVIIDINKPDVIIDISATPVLSPGATGEFDDSGAMASWLAESDGKKFLYYIGWNLGVTVPFRNSIGLATSVENREFARYAPGPIVDRTMTEPHFCASCCVIPGADKWRMWYLSCIGWDQRNGKLEHRYHIKYAESSDGILWDRNGTVAIDFANETEYAISRPSVIRDEEGWRMWYSFRGESYRIGYAYSQDGIKWDRHDTATGIGVSDAGWDSEMIEYPHVFNHKERLYMLYNGNDFGKSGFGLAVLE